MEEIWVRKCSSWEEEAEADREFWARMSPGERVETVESIRLDLFAMRGESEERLRRVARVLRREGS